jgi:hypothetical protein
LQHVTCTTDWYLQHVTCTTDWYLQQAHHYDGSDFVVSAATRHSP